MTETKPSLRFDHREIAVIFSLFIFVSLLMFTVGILVGKGLAQARYEGSLALEGDRSRAANLEKSTAISPIGETNTGTSVTNGDNERPMPGAGDQGQSEGEKMAAQKPEPKPLQLIPQKPKPLDLAGNSLQEPSKSKDTDDILKNPKIRALLDESGAGGKRALASAKAAKDTVSGIPAGKKLPASFPQGKFTVQVGSYATQQEANERVEALKKLGFLHAYVSTKELGDKKDTWYRVWLGYYPDFESAQTSGQILQERGEVKNYLVRKTDNAG